MFYSKQTGEKKDALSPITEKLGGLLAAIGLSKISVEPHQLPELMRLKTSIAYCDILVEDDEPYQHRLQEAIDVLPEINAYFSKKAGAMNVITALKTLQEAMETLNTSLKAKAGGEKPKTR